MNGTIYVGFSRAPGFVSKAIRWLTRGDVSHASLAYVDSKWGGWWVAEADAHGVHTRPMPQPRDWRYVYEITYDVETDMGNAKQYFDESYDFAGAGIYAWVLLIGRVFHRRLRFPTRSTGGQFCSEFIARVLRRALAGRNPQWTSPQQLREVVESNKLFFKAVDKDLIFKGE